MEDNQILILEAQTFDSKKVNEKGNPIIYNTLFCVQKNKYGHLVSNVQFCSDAVMQQYTGPGVYKGDYSVYFDKNGGSRARLYKLEKIKKVEF